jgi:hypothetical protein
MKRNLFRTSLAIVITLLAVNFASAQMYVHDRPNRPAPMAHRPSSPGKGYVWVDEDWKWNNGHYDWAGGNWVRPPYRGAVWVAGRWSNSRKGSRWTAGHWTHK